MYVSTKSYGPTEGFAVAYRQWRADRKSGKGPNEVYTHDEIPGCHVGKYGHQYPDQTGCPGVSIEVKSFHHLDV